MCLENKTYSTHFIRDWPYLDITKLYNRKAFFMGYNHTPFPALL